MKRELIILIIFCFYVFGCRKSEAVVVNSDPINYLPTVVTDETDADIIEVPAPVPLIKDGETVYPIYYAGEAAFTRNRVEWESWLQDPSKAPLPALHNDRNFVLTWCHQFAHYEPEEVGLILMDYFDYDINYIYPSNPYYYTSNPHRSFFNWKGLRKCIQDRKLVCAGYAQLFYLIVRERYPDVKYITSRTLNHARNYFENEHWDITWLDDKGVDYNSGKIKFDFVGMQNRISAKTSNDWIIVNLYDEGL